MKEKTARPTNTLLLLGTGGALLLLAIASLSLSSIPLGIWSLPLALCIAALKAILLVSVFMELRHESASVKLAGVSAVLMLLLLVAFTATDVATRRVPTFLPPAPAPARG